MEVDKSLYIFGQQLLDNFDKQRAKQILDRTLATHDKELDEQEDALLKPNDKGTHSW